MDHRALHDALESGGRLGVFGAIADQVLEFSFEITDEAAAQLVEIDAAGTHHSGRIGIVNQRKQKMFERRVLMVAFVCYRECAMQGLFKALRKSRHSLPLWPPPFWPFEYSSQPFPPLFLSSGILLCGCLVVLESSAS